LANVKQRNLQVLMCQCDFQGKEVSRFENRSLHQQVEKITVFSIADIRAQEIQCNYCNCNSIMKNDGTILTTTERHKKRAGRRKREFL